MIADLPQLDTDDPEAQDAKILGEQFARASADWFNGADGRALREAARAQLEHMERTGWAYTKRTAQKLTGSHWTYYHGENVAVEIYDK